MQTRRIASWPIHVRNLLVALSVLFGACGDNKVPDKVPDSAKEITAYALRAANNPGLAADVNGTISGSSIDVMVPFGTSVTGLVATFTTTGASVTVGGVEQMSGVTANDLTTPVAYRVTAADGSTRDYTVTVTVAADTAKELTAYAFLAANNPGLGTDVTGTITGTAIAVTVPFGTNVTSLVATFATTGTGVTVAGTAQTSGATANSFTNPVVYRVTAADGSTRDYTVTVAIAPDTAKELTSYAFRSADNATLSADVIGTISGTNISVTVPFGANVTALVATFTTAGANVSVAGTAQASGATANNFTNPVVYRVTAADGSTKDYTVTVTIAPNDARDLTSFAFLAADNGALSADATATITGTSIAVTVPSGTNVSALVATFSTTGASVTVGGVAQVSGTTANNFTSPVVYRVTAANGMTKDYTVTVMVAATNAKNITSYAFLSVDNPGLGADVIATINSTTIALTVPFGTDVTGLVATFTTSGASVKVAGIAQVSGTTANDFTNPVVYRVTAADSSTLDYNVVVTVAANTAKDLTSFAFLSVGNPTLATDVTGTINGTTIALTVPFGTNVAGLVATFATTGTGVTVGGVAQVSGVTANNFTNPVIYRVIAADNSTKDYTVTVTVALNGARDLTSFAFLAADNATLSVDVTGTITGTTIALTVPSGTNVTALVATFSTTGTGVTVGGVAQVSGTTANNFTNPVVYRVTAANGMTKDYTVTVTVAATNAKNITSYAFLSVDNPGLGADVIATINGTTIALTVPFGTDVTGLIATFTASGASVTVAGIAQVSGTTANNFANPVVYRVTAADSSTRDYTVVVTVAANTAKDITAFAFLSADNPTLAANVTGTINGTTIALTVPFGTNVTGLVATYATTGAGVTVGGVAQVSGVTANNFTSSVIYRVTAADNSTKDYTVTVTIAPSTANELTSFVFRSVDNPGLIADVSGTITGTTVALTVPSGTNVTALIATFVTTGTAVAIGATTQVSGVTANNFTSAKVYTVTASDGSTRDYTVMVAVGQSSAKQITSFAFLSASNSNLPADVIGTINGTAIAVTVPFGTNVTGLVATFATTGASVTIGGTQQVSGVTANNFTNPVVYRVTAADSTTQDYTVTVTIAADTAKELTAFSFLATDNPGLAADVSGRIIGTSVALTVPFGTNVTALVATFATTGKSVSIAGTLQVSGITANNFTTALVYRVTAADNSTKDFTVKVTIATDSSKDLTSFVFRSVDNPGLAVDVAGTITGTTIALTVPAGTDVTALVATFSASVASSNATNSGVTIGVVDQVSGVTVNNFTNPLVYRVTAADGSTRDYTVRVTVASTSSKEITSFGFRSAENSGLAVDVTGTVSGSAISLTVPAGTNVTALVATFSTTGKTVTIGGAAQVSGITPNDFTSPVVYRVTAADSTTRDYTVTVTVAAMAAKDITSFAFTPAHNPGLASDVFATISGTTISLTVPFGTNVTGLVARYETTGATVTIGGTVQASGVTANNFTNPVTYRVTAADSSTKDYTVTVTVAPDTANLITSFRFLSVHNPGLAADATGTISGNTISVTLPTGTNVTALVATFSMTGQSVAVGGTAQKSGLTSNNFTSAVVYRVTAGDGSIRDYAVSVTFQ